MPDAGSEGTSSSASPAGVYGHDRQHMKRQIQRTGRGPPEHLWALLQQTLAAVLLSPRTRFATEFPRVELALELQGSFTVIAVEQQAPGRDVTVQRENVATGSWRWGGAEVELQAAVIYGFHVHATGASRCSLGFREGALWIALGTVDDHAWSLRIERLASPEP
jgi:hypothetical protein